MTFRAQTLHVGQIGDDRVGGLQRGAARVYAIDVVAVVMADVSPEVFEAISKGGLDVAAYL